MNSFSLRIIGFVSLTIWYILVSFIGFSNQLLAVCIGVIGTVSITIFIFLSIEGYKKTKNVTKYLMRLLISAAIAGIPYYLITKGALAEGTYYNGIFTVIFLVGGISFYDKIKNKNVRYFLILLVIISSIFVGLEWAPFALIAGFIMFIYWNQRKMMSFNIIALYITLALVSMYMLVSNANGVNKNELHINDEWLINISQLGCIIGLFLIKKYNGKRGPNFRLAFYAFYPLMLTSIYLIKDVLFK